MVIILGLICLPHILEYEANTVTSDRLTRKDRAAALALYRGPHHRHALCCRMPGYPPLHVCAAVRRVLVLYTTYLLAAALSALARGLQVSHTNKFLKL